MALTAGIPAGLSAFGRRAVERIGLSFGLLCLAAAGLPALLFRGDRFSRRRTVEALYDTILRPLPVLTVLAALAGAVIAFAMSEALRTINIEPPLLLALRLGLMRDVMPLLVGIFVAGRSGVALSVRIGRMTVDGEIDALRIMGLHPVSFILPAYLLAFTTGAAALYVWSVGIGHAVAATTLQAMNGLPNARYAAIVFAPSAAHSLWLGLLRVEAYALTVLVVAASEGGAAAATAQALETVARRTFVSSLLIIFAIAAVLSGLGT